MSRNHINFIRITWAEALSELKIALQKKYHVCGEIRFKEDAGSEGVIDYYFQPTFVDIELEERL